MPSEKKPRPCYIWRGKVYDQQLTYRDAEPAVAVPMADYREVRETLLHAHKYAKALVLHAMEKRIDEALALLPEVPDV